MCYMVSREVQRSTGLLPPSTALRG